MKKSHRVAHENQRRGGFCYNYYTLRGVNVKYYLTLLFHYSLYATSVTRSVTEVAYSVNLCCDFSLFTVAIAFLFHIFFIFCFVARVTIPPCCIKRKFHFLLIHLYRINREFPSVHGICHRNHFRNSHAWPVSKLHIWTTFSVFLSYRCSIYLFRINI